MFIEYGIQQTHQSPRGATCGYNALCVNAQRFIAAFRPSRAECPICLNRRLGGLGGGHGLKTEAPSQREQR